MSSFILSSQSVVIGVVRRVILCLHVRCPVQKCSLCQGLGHLTKDCNLIRCNLCGVIGHPYSQCSETMHNEPDLMPEFFRLEDTWDGVLRLLEDPIVSESLSTPLQSLCPIQSSISLSTSVSEPDVSPLPSSSGVSGASRLAVRSVAKPRASKIFGPQRGQGWRWSFRCRRFPNPEKLNQ